VGYLVLMDKSDIDRIAEDAYEAGYAGEDSETLPVRYRHETGFELVWLDSYREGVRDANDNASYDQACDWEQRMIYGESNWD